MSSSVLFEMTLASFLVLSCIIHNSSFILNPSSPVGLNLKEYLPVLSTGWTPKP